MANETANQLWSLLEAENPGMEMFMPWKGLRSCLTVIDCTSDFDKGTSMRVECSPFILNGTDYGTYCMCALVFDSAGERCESTQSRSLLWVVRYLYLIPIVWGLICLVRSLRVLVVCYSRGTLSANPAVLTILQATVTTIFSNVFSVSTMMVYFIGTQEAATTLALSALFAFLGVGSTLTTVTLVWRKVTIAMQSYKSVDMNRISKGEKASVLLPIGLVSCTYMVLILNQQYSTATLVVLCYFLVLSFWYSSVGFRLWRYLQAAASMPGSEGAKAESFARNARRTLRFIVRVLIFFTVLMFCLTIYAQDSTMGTISIVRLQAPPRSHFFVVVIHCMYPFVLRACINFTAENLLSPKASRRVHDANSGTKQTVVTTSQAL